MVEMIHEHSGEERRGVEKVAANELYNVALEGGHRFLLVTKIFG